MGTFKDLVKETFEDQILTNWYGRDITLTKKTPTYDSDGNLIDMDDTDSTITGAVIPINDENKEIFNIGRFNQGDAYGYFKIADDVQEDDYITSGDNTYEVTKILSRADGIDGNSCFTACYLQIRSR